MDSSAISAILTDIKIGWEPTKDEVKAIELMISGTKTRTALNICGLKYGSHTSRYRVVRNLADSLFIYLFNFDQNPNPT